MCFSRWNCIHIDHLFLSLNMCMIYPNTSREIYIKYKISVLFINIQWEINTQDKTLFVRKDGHINLDRSRICQQHFLPCYTPFKDIFNQIVQSSYQDLIHLLKECILILWYSFYLLTNFCSPLFATAFFFPGVYNIYPSSDLRPVSTGCSVYLFAFYYK